MRLEDRFDIMWRSVDCLLGLASLAWAAFDASHGGAIWLIVLNIIFGVQCLLSAAFGWTWRIFVRLRPTVRALLLAASLPLR